MIIWKEGDFMEWVMFGGVILGLKLAYTLIPDLFLHHLGLGSWLRQYQPGISLTFDDGPDPASTPALLDLLDQHGVKALFFMVGEKAQRYPELVREIVGRGHQIGLHGQVHRHAWLMGPVRTWRNWSQGKQVLEEISGVPLRWMRPPWGVFNLVTWIWLRANGLHAILWGASSHDWNGESAQTIARRILKEVREGSIVVLHESRKEKWSFENTRQAVDLILYQISSALKLPIVELELPDWGMGRRLAFRLWEAWERLYAKTNGIRRIDAANIYRLGLITYHGREILDETGTVLASEGDRVIELHLDSARMQSRSDQPARIAVEALRKTKNSLPGLAAFVAGEPAYRDIPVLVSITLINRGLGGLGFQVEDVPPTLHVRWMGVIQRMILRIYHPMGKSAKNRKSHMGQPKLVWISRAELMKRWLAKPVQGAEQHREEDGEREGEILRSSDLTGSELLSDQIIGMNPDRVSSQE